MVPDGWTIEGSVAIHLDGRRVEVVTDGDPTNALLANIAQLDGAPTTDGYGLPPTTEQLASAALVGVRAQRDTLLAACDWTQMADSPLDATAKAAWATYRQQLRDYPDQQGFDPLNPPPWPIPPA